MFGLFPDSVALGVLWWESMSRRRYLGRKDMILSYCVFYFTVPRQFYSWSCKKVILNCNFLRASFARLKLTVFEVKLI
jgi:hypothetical protein